MSHNEDKKFITPPIVFTLEEKVEELTEELSYLREGYRGACPTCEPVGELNLQQSELLDYYTRFIIKNNLEEAFDAFVSKELENE